MLLVKIFFKTTLVLIIFCLSFVSAKAQTPIINIPNFGQQSKLNEGTIFWYGKVNDSDNYTDIRVGYTNTDFKIHFSVFDKQFWYDKNLASSDSLQNYDSVSLLIYVPTTDQKYKFVSQINHFENDLNYQSAYKYQQEFVQTNINFTTNSAYRGSSPNDNSSDERGWSSTFTIPFNSLNLQTPNIGDKWLLMLTTQDKDDLQQQVKISKWPTSAIEENTNTWGEIVFGLSNTQTNTQSENVVTLFGSPNVEDAMVGGGTICGSDFNPNFFAGWGEKSYPKATQINIQNQWDSADWPCFSKFFIKANLNNLPNNVEVTKALLTMHLFGGSNPAEAKPSLIQVLQVNPFNEVGLNWNNAPQVIRHLDRQWVNPKLTPLVWPGDKYQWDITKAFSNLNEDTHLYLGLYSADGDYHSGKYFSSSYTGEWNSEAKPKITIYYKNKPTPTPIVGNEKLDINQDGLINLKDVIDLIKYLFT